MTLKDTGATIYTIKEVLACFSPNSYINDTNDCRKKISNGFQLILAVASVIKDNPETAWGLVKTEAEKFVDNYVGSEPINKYYKGRFAFEVLSMFIGVGEVSATLKTLDAVKLAKLLEKTAKAASEFNVVGRMMSKVGVVITKTGNKAGAFIIRRADGTIAKVVAEYVDGVYKFFRQKTSDFKKRIGVTYNSNYDIPGANGAANKKGKGDIEIYVKETTTDSNVADDIALNVIKRTWRSAEEMRSEVKAWAQQYLNSLPTDTQKDKFNKATIASYINEDGKWESVFGRNGGVLNTHASYPSISAQKVIGLQKELADRLPKNTKYHHMANCAECDAVNQALKNKAKWEDIQIHTIEIRKGIMSDVTRCEEYLDIFKGMHVTSER